jgi:glycine/D-amino acid oxidase-like deaminating enzyme
MELEGQVAIVTGAGRGIGRATALELARMGADIVVAELDRANAEGWRAWYGCSKKGLPSPASSYCCPRWTICSSTISLSLLLARVQGWAGGCSHSRRPKHCGAAMPKSGSTLIKRWWRINASTIQSAMKRQDAALRPAMTASSCASSFADSWGGFERVP